MSKQVESEEIKRKKLEEKMAGLKVSEDQQENSEQIEAKISRIQIELEKEKTGESEYVAQIGELERISADLQNQMGEEAEAIVVKQDLYDGLQQLASKLEAEDKSIQEMVENIDGKIEEAITGKADETQKTTKLQYEGFELEKEAQNLKGQTVQHQGEIQKLKAIHEQKQTTLDSTLKYMAEVVELVDKSEKGKKAAIASQEAIALAQKRSEELDKALQAKQMLIDQQKKEEYLKMLDNERRKKEQEMLQQSA